MKTKSFTIPQNITSYNLDNVFMGTVPKRMIIGFVSNEAYNGRLQSNPFYFQTFNLNKLQLQLGSRSIPITPITPDYANNLCIQAYFQLFAGTGIHYQDTGNGISRDEFHKGYTLYAFNLSSNIDCNDGTWELVHDSNVTLKVGFSEALASAITCIVYAEFDSLIQIDKHRNIYTDFTK